MSAACSRRTCRNKVLDKRKDGTYYKTCSKCRKKGREHTQSHVARQDYCTLGIIEDGESKRYRIGKLHQSYSVRHGTEAHAFVCNKLKQKFHFHDDGSFEGEAKEVENCTKKYIAEWQSRDIPQEPRPARVCISLARRIRDVCTNYVVTTETVTSEEKVHSWYVSDTDTAKTFFRKSVDTITAQKKQVGVSSVYLSECGMILSMSNGICDQLLACLNKVFESLVPD
jgi:hypothetical protein